MLAAFLRLTTLGSLLTAGLCTERTITPGTIPTITNKAELNAAIEAGPNRRVGFLSMANFNSVHTVLSARIEPVIYVDTSDLYRAVQNESVLAGFISGVPHSNFTSFSSEKVSPRAFQVSPIPEARQLLEAVDAAVVRTHNQGEVFKAVQANSPFQAIEVHTCRSEDPSKVPFPPAATATGLLKDVLDTKKLRMLSYGTPDNVPDWDEDGDYTVEPPTGFWPDYMRSFMNHFKAAYGDDIELERVWMISGGNDAVLTRDVHLTAPYYIYENLHNDRVKKWSFSFSCIVAGYEQQFFAKKTGYTMSIETDANEGGNTESCESQLQTCTNRRVRNAITSRAELNVALETGPNKRMGFLSEANSMSVHTMLSNMVEPMYYADTSDLYDAVRNGTVLAGLISGQPHDNFTKFSTDIISPRSFQMSPNRTMSRDLMEAVDAAVVRTHNAAEVLQAVQRNPPFEATEVHTCRASDITKVPFPSASTATGLLKDVLDNKKLRISSYGSLDNKPNWLQDGNYEVEPPVGFWPDYMIYFMNHFRAEYGQDIELERVWMRSGAYDMILNGSIHMTEPYYVYENMYNNRLRKWQLEFSCIVMGYEQQFFSLRAETDFTAAGSTCAQQLARCENRLSDVGGASRGSLLVSAVWLIGFMTFG